MYQCISIPTCLTLAYLTFVILTTCVRFIGANLKLFGLEKTATFFFVPFPE